MLSGKPGESLRLSTHFASLLGMTTAPQNPIEVNTLLTHAHPDLDAGLSVYLLRKHGETHFPGVTDAKLEFVSANTLPRGKTADELEKEGLLAVDTGGGRFDNHPVQGELNEEKWDTCAAEMVAKALTVNEDNRYRFILPFTLYQDTQGRSLTSKDATHHLLAPHSLLDGLHRLLEDDEKVINALVPLIDGLAKHAEGDNIDLQAYAGLFDRTLAAFFDGDYQPLSEYDRQETDTWPTEGVAHTNARANGWERKRELEKLLRTDARLLAGDYLSLPEKEDEQRVLLPAALHGLSLLYGEDSDEFRQAAFTLIKAAVQREADWFGALDEVKRSARVIRGRGGTLLAIASRNGLVIKAARYRRGNHAVLYFDPGTGNVTVQAGLKPDGNPRLDLKQVAATLRLAELIKRGKRPKLDNVDGVGMVGGWFLHPSLQLLNRGSQKAPDVARTAFTYPELIEIVSCAVQPEKKLPEPYCPDDKCLDKSCVFYSLRLSNCFNHRRNLKEQPKKGTLGDLFGDELSKVKPKSDKKKNRKKR